jgi:hypothetical protein
MSRITEQSTRTRIAQDFPSHEIVCVRSGIRLVDNQWEEIKRPVSEIEEIAPRFRRLEFKLQLSGAAPIYPSFHVYQLGFTWGVGDTFAYYLNKGYVDATVVAVLGDEVLVSYQRRDGSVVFNVLDNSRPAAWRRTYSAAKLPKKWMQAMTLAAAVIGYVAEDERKQARTQAARKSA